MNVRIPSEAILLIQLNDPIVKTFADYIMFDKVENMILQNAVIYHILQTTIAFIFIL